MLVPCGGVVTVAVEVPDCPLAVKPWPVAVPAAQEYEMAMDMPTSAVCGSHESVACPAEHCQLVTQDPE